eukprot:436150-Pyramimonas_sp.AAC.1
MEAHLPGMLGYAMPADALSTHVHGSVCICTFLFSVSPTALERWPANHSPCEVHSEECMLTQAVKSVIQPTAFNADRLVLVRHFPRLP